LIRLKAKFPSLPFNFSIGQIFILLRLLLDSKEDVLLGRVKKVFHIKQFDLKLDELLPLGGLDEFAFCLHIVEDLLNDSKVMEVLTIFFKHGLPTHELKQTRHKLVQNLQCYPRFQSPGWVTEACLLTKLKLLRVLVPVDELQIVGILDTY
jgi:hypothetical protein